MRLYAEHTTQPIKLLALALFLVIASGLAQAQSTVQRHAARKDTPVSPSGVTSMVTGSGTTGSLTKWTSPNAIGDSTISENKSGQVGIGTTTPTSKLTVAGVIEAKSGGIKFPDGTVQTTAASETTTQTASPALQPFAQSFSTNFPPGGSAASASAGVPAGKRLVIETVSLLVNIPQGDNILSAAIQTTVGGQVVTYSLFPSQIFDDVAGESSFGLTQSLKLYADPGSQIIVRVNCATTAGQTFGFSAAVSGYLVDVP